ncbi:bactofilin family protein [Luteimonas aquatica]|uniref:bactofilin family protein n=1 Tax=Luteimonas aquatica TaxID=450364 RepID=UPI001F581AD2|nr:polymer-forming cytoskeletal protein [Luteimonas aquatica]
MAIFNNQQSPAKKDTLPFGEPSPPPVREAAPAVADFSVPTPQPQPAAPRPAPQPETKESVIAADLTIEGKIEGTGHVRIAGKFKGDVNVQGDLTIENGAKLNGGVRAKRVVVAGELEGNIESASNVELQPSSVLVGDLKAGSLTIASGARVRGHVECGWGEKDGAKANGKASAAKSEEPSLVQ